MEQNLNNEVTLRNKFGSLLATLYLPVAGGFDFVFIEYISDRIDSVSLAFIRLTVSVIVMLIVHQIKVGRLRIEKEDRLAFLLAGGVGFGLYYILEAVGIAKTSAALSSLLLALVPIFGLFGDRLVFKNPITPMKAIGVVISIVGVAIIILSTSGSEISGSILGIGALILACIIWAAYIIIAKPLNKKYNIISLTTALFIAGVMVVLPFFLLSQPTNVLALTPLDWLFIVVETSICIVLADCLYMFGVKNLSVTITSIVLNLLPFVTIIVAWFVFKETLSLIQFAGGALIMVAIFFVVFSDAKNDK